MPRIISQRVTPSASAPSRMSRGAVSSTSREMLVTIGSIIRLSTRIAGSMPTGDGSPLNNGIQPSTLFSHGSRCVCTKGPSTRMPQSPSTTEGIAARSSTRIASGWRTQRGESSVR